MLTKCKNKFDCLVKKMLFICRLVPDLNVQTDSICTKFFVNALCSFFNFFQLSVGLLAMCGLRGGGRVLYQFILFFSRPVPLFLYVKFSLFTFCLPIHGCNIALFNCTKVIFSRWSGSISGAARRTADAVEDE